jgi:hypothetical protein
MLPSPMPKSEFTHQTVAAASASAVWDRLQEAATWAGIGPVEEVWDPVHDEQGRLQSYRWKAVVGPRSYLGSATVVASERDRSMRLRLDGNEVAGDLTAELVAAPGGSTHLTVTLAIESVGVLSTVFFPLVSQAVGRGLPDQVEAFALSLDGNARGR